jgi:hypothetical protein
MGGNEIDRASTYRSDATYTVPRMHVASSTHVGGLLCPRALRYTDADVREHTYPLARARARAAADPCGRVLTARVYADITKQATSDLKIYE